MRNYYKKHYLKKVLVRIDFASEIQSLNNNIPSGITNKILNSFPISEPKKTITKQLQISPQHGIKEIQSVPG